MPRGAMSFLEWEGHGNTMRRIAWQELNAAASGAGQEHSDIGESAESTHLASYGSPKGRPYWSLSAAKGWKLCYAPSPPGQAGGRVSGSSRQAGGALPIQGLDYRPFAAAASSDPQEHRARTLPPLGSISPHRTRLSRDSDDLKRGVYISNRRGGPLLSEARDSLLRRGGGDAIAPMSAR
eukprot:TRINITY_DN7212_c0_g2_i1.p1 TRINITY_DN7212_c0_g2~~TRINITY_DN7212_c0_g2_i1.p1  ORF type:complete len:180 (-),score=13.58 TRINITY_DN7212_c0_g2_i1:198-737(-)